MSKKLSRELVAQKVKSDRIESIRTLNLWGNNIDDISLIEEMPSLEIVSLAVNKIKTLKPFANLQNLKELYLRRNLISNLNEIKYLTNCENLNILWLSENPISENPNYRSVVIGVLPQLVKLDDIVITDEERIKAEKKLSGNYDEDEDENETDIIEPQKQEISNNNNRVMRKSVPNTNLQKSNKNYEEKEEEIFRNNNFNDDDEYNKPKMGNFKKMRSQQIENNYGNMFNNRREDYNNNYGKRGGGYNDYNNDGRDVKKKGNSNVLNCVINLLKELSHNELQIVKREITRIDS